ncbi:hypothetical protein [Endozoicomonas euniceicola]|uniref:Uncharacterized protein n=1 Tax=Endozoicomonas euniceicola TaxID=1234143 RepID=A0ABY6GTS3_9GAMM|nr:hypothetical protein [Endozoicomonas euniceicola]UYM16160.1 hypothetical protein NX720_25745 [Endozoicomonas euniceicola]
MQKVGLFRCVALQILGFSLPSSLFVASPPVAATDEIICKSISSKPSTFPESPFLTDGSQFCFKPDGGSQSGFPKSALQYFLEGCAKSLLKTHSAAITFPVSLWHSNDALALPEAPFPPPSIAGLPFKNALIPDSAFSVSLGWKLQQALISRQGLAKKNSQPAIAFSLSNASMRVVIIREEAGRQLNLVSLYEKIVSIQIQSYLSLLDAEALNEVSGIVTGGGLASGSGGDGDDGDDGSYNTFDYDPEPLIVIHNDVVYPEQDSVSELISKNQKIKRLLLKILRRKMQLAIVAGNGDMARVLDNRIMLIEADLEHLASQNKQNTGATESEPVSPGVLSLLKASLATYSSELQGYDDDSLREALAQYTGSIDNQDIAIFTNGLPSQEKLLYLLWLDTPPGMVYHELKKRLGRQLWLWAGKYDDEDAKTSIDTLVFSLKALVQQYRESIASLPGQYSGRQVACGGESSQRSSTPIPTGGKGTGTGTVKRTSTDRRMDEEGGNDNEDSRRKMPRGEEGPSVDSGSIENSNRQITTLPGYVTGNLPLTSLDDGRIFMHTMTRRDLKQMKEKEIVVDKLIAYLKGSLGMSQTQLLTALIPALEFTPYLRKLSSDEEKDALDDPWKLQQYLIKALLTKMQHAFSLFSLQRSVGALIETNSRLIGYSYADRIHIADIEITKDQLGDETFREIKSRMISKKGSKNQTEKIKNIINDLVQRKKRSLQYWNSIYYQIISIQNPEVKNQIQTFTNRDDQHHGLLPYNEQQCEQLKAMIARQRLVVHPAFTVMKPLFFWLSQHHLGKQKLTSEKLGWLRSYFQKILYTSISLEDETLERLPVSKDPLADAEGASGIAGAIKSAVESARSEELASAVELFSKLLCDLTPSVTLKDRLAIVYTAMKFRNQELLKGLLVTSSMGEDVFLSMYKPLLILVYGLDPDADSKKKELIEKSLNCLLKTLLVRMAQCTSLIDKDGRISVDPTVLTKASALIAHHNATIRNALSDLQEEQEYMDYDDDGFVQNNKQISDDDYLALSEVAGAEVTCDRQQLILPEGKHLRNYIALQQRDAIPKREIRAERDGNRLVHDVLHVPQAKKLDLSIKAFEIPISYLFSAKNGIFIQHPEVVADFTRAVGEVASSVPASSETMEIIKSLLALSRTLRKTAGKAQSLLIAIESDCHDEILKKILGIVASTIEKIPDKHSKRQLLQYTACLLFFKTPHGAELNSLIKFLYTINSRAKELVYDNDGYGRFSNSETSKLKLMLAKLFNQKLVQPDGMQGEQIKKALITMLTSCYDINNVMNQLLESICPEGIATEDYKAMLEQQIAEFTGIFQGITEIDELTREVDIMDSNTEVVSENKMIEELKALIYDAAVLTDKFLTKAASSSSSPIAQNSISWGSANQASDFEKSVGVCLSHQLRDTLNDIGIFINGIDLENHLTEDDIADINNKIEKLATYLEQPTSEQTYLRDGHDRVAVTRDIIGLGGQLRKLQLKHANYCIRNPIATINQKCESARNDLMNLEKAGPLPTPEELQSTIDRLTVQGSDELTCDERTALASVQALRRSRSDRKNLLKAFEHKDFHQFKRTPEAVSEQISELSERYSEHDRRRHLELTYLEIQMNGLRRDPLIRNFSDEKDRKISEFMRKHQKTMSFLSKRQRECENHLVTGMPDAGGASSLSAVLGDMQLTHECQKLGITAAPASIREKQQLLGLATTVMPEMDQESSDSLFHMIGLRSTKIKKRKAVTDKWDENLTLIKEAKDEIMLKQQSKKEELCSKQKKAQQLNDYLTRSYDTKRNDFLRYSERLNKLLGDRKHAIIRIGNLDYPYVDAILAYQVYGNKENHFSTGVYFHSVTLEQQDASRWLSHFADVKKYEKNSLKTDKEWVDLAYRCKSERINPELLAEILQLIELERFLNLDDLEDRAATVSDQIKLLLQTQSDNLKRIDQKVREIEASFKKELDTQRQNTRDAQVALFHKAFEHGQGLSSRRMAQRYLCESFRRQQLQQTSTAGDVREKIVQQYKDFSEQERTGKSHEKLRQQYESLKENGHEYYIDRMPIEYPFRWDEDDPRMSWHSLIFNIINVKGAYPLLNHLFKKRVISPHELLIREKGQTVSSSALILAAAIGRYNSCQALLEALGEFESYFIELAHNLLTSSPSPDQRNLFHHVANLAKPDLIESMLKALNDISQKQDYDTDYPDDSLQNIVALDKAFILKELLSQRDYENRLPGDILLFRIGERIKNWPEGEMQKLYAFCNDFLINHMKQMWRVTAETLDVSQLHTMFECFIKGLGNVDELSPEGREQAGYFVRSLLRIIRVHGPKGVQDALLNEMASF